MEKVACAYCKKEFMKKHPSQRFCCDKCRYSYWNKKQHNRNIRAKNKRGYPSNNLIVDDLSYALYLKELQGEIMSEEAVQGEW